MLEFGKWDAARGWVKQLHLGALRDIGGDRERRFRQRGVHGREGIRAASHKHEGMGRCEGAGEGGADTGTGTGDDGDGLGGGHAGICAGG